MAQEKYSSIPKFFIDIQFLYGANLQKTSSCHTGRRRLKSSFFYFEYNFFSFLFFLGSNFFFCIVFFGMLETYSRLDFIKTFPVDS